ncbi:MAG: alpha/beta hydrolase [Burkholderiaceae bacterium]
MYQVKRAARSAFIPIRNLDYHVWTWGDPVPGARPLFMVHGWMDVAASFQFVVDALSDPFAQGRQIIAPDWRGYGLTRCPGEDDYTHADYLGDLDFLIDHFCPGQQVDLVGHSMGGNVAMYYAGIRPERIRRLVNIEGFGGPDSTPDEAPARYAKWMDQLKKLHRGELALRAYDNCAGVARRLAKTNPRLARDEAGRDKADWLAAHWARPKADGKWEILGDPAHKLINAQLFRTDELIALYKRLSMPVLVVEASDSELAGWWQGRFSLAEFHRRLENVPDCRTTMVQDAGHMLHHDQPEQLARLLEDFLGA